MNVLIAVASKHGSSIGIGQAIAAVLHERGLGAEVTSIDDGPTLDGHDAVIIGSGVYAGHWMGQARRFVDGHEDALRTMPVWLFSSGPVGDPPKPLENPAEAIGVAKQIDARGHRLFAGRLEADDLGLGEKALVKLVRASEGDYRPWPEISEWADSIADALLEPTSPPT